MQTIVADGGIIGKNPSRIGGTYAVCLLDDEGEIVWTDCNVVLGNGHPVTNNQTEMIAILAGLRRVPDDWCGVVMSDSRITLGRLFENWRLKNLPPKIVRCMNDTRKRLIHFNKIKWVPLGGHPTQRELDVGVNHKGVAVSRVQVMMDEMCSSLAKQFLVGSVRRI